MGEVQRKMEVQWGGLEWRNGGYRRVGDSAEGKEEAGTRDKEDSEVEKQGLDTFWCSFNCLP